MIGKIAGLVQSFSPDRVFAQYGKDDEVKTVSFDIFDTIVFRDVAWPSDVFIVVEKLCEGIEDFAKIRREAEGEATTLDEIYDAVQRRSECSDEVKDRYKVCEVRCEIELSHPNLIMVEPLKRFKEAGKRIILTSDMYLSKDVIKSLLNHCGIEEGLHYDSLFVSCEENATKKSGELFNIVLRREKLKPHQLLHIGDAVRSDYLVPLGIGIRAEHYSRYGVKHEISGRIENRVHSYSSSNKSEKGENHKRIENTDFEHRTLTAFIDNHTQGWNYYETFGYKNLGPLVYGFAKWLDKEIKGLRYEGTIYFLAREGKIFKDAYESIGGNNPTQYVLVSRRSIIAALLWRCSSVEEMLQSLSFHRAVSIDMVCSLMNIKRGSFDNRHYKNMSNLLSDDEAISFFRNQENEVCEKSKEQHRLMTAYFDSIGLNSTDSVIIVDIGWQGTMQKWLQRYWESINVNKDVTGLYMGVKKNFTSKDKRGWLFDKGRGIPEYKTFSFGGLLESMLSEAEGSVQKYKDTGDGIVVIRDRFEWSKNTVFDMWRGVFRFIDCFHSSILEKSISITVNESSKRLIQFGNHPSKVDIESIGRLNYEDNTYEQQMFDDYEKGFIHNLMQSNWKIGKMEKEYGRLFPAYLIYRSSYILRGVFFGKSSKKSFK